MPKPWNDPSFKEKPDTPPRQAVDPDAVIHAPFIFMTCPNCNKPYALGVVDHCVCSIWDIGKA